MWMSSSEYCLKGCRIMVGWDTNRYDVMEMFMIDQVMHCLVKQLSSGEHFFCSIIYAEDDHVPRRKLWHSLEVFRQLVGDVSWIMLGDFNAILSTTECEGGMVGNSPAIMEFQDWTSDHSPILVKFEDVQVQSKGSFKFQNFLAFRNNFLDIVKLKWVEKVAGVRMFQIVQKMRNMKPMFRKAARDSGNLCDIVQGLAKSLKQIQFELDAAPFNEHWKLQEAKCLQDYRETALEEEQWLKQQ
ncbi:hypothetical protein POM88_048238 [Heracleum sosnowskyi]|uniref:Endonuclease/exonuclease/phosphatase domain-containing protein n=1 Tax=Heracleum sosnowskyi TaxID=360622 RepID=A0AAD8GTI4_9APIA|nr:hypothetical protein POM88_048238 [Heracleum sosnowskyi]